MEPVNNEVAFCFYTPLCNRSSITAGQYAITPFRLSISVCLSV
jgi:hypothetical protein